METDRRGARASTHSAPVLLVSILLLASAATGGPPGRPAGSAGAATVFAGVHVVPLDKPGILKNRTVLVEGQRIADIGPAGSVEFPDGSTVIDARGKYLMPGLADMHVHVWCEGDLLLYVANGVTTIRNMSGSDLQLDWRERTASGALLGPTLFTSGPIVDADAPPSRARVDTPEQARAVVAEQKQAGYDFVKVYSHLSLESYDAIVAAARMHGMPVVGHVPYAVGLEHALQAGQASIEHVDDFGSALEVEPPQDDASAFVRMVRAWESADDDRIASLARRTGASGVWVCPTLSAFDGRLAPPEVKQAALERPEVRFVFPPQLRDWEAAQGHEPTYRSFLASEPKRYRLTKELWKAGQRVLLGTDTANPFLIPGFSIHAELRHLVKAGLTPYEALRAGTHNAAEFVGGLEEFGAVARGLRADLILLNGNPLEDVRHVEDRIGVMVRGHWYPQAELTRRLEALAASYAEDRPRSGSADERPRARRPASGQAASAGRIDGSPR